jgi:ankyrin repeat protein
LIIILNKLKIFFLSLHRAAQEGQQEALGLFLERATNAVDTKDSTGSTPLHW